MQAHDSLGRSSAGTVGRISTNQQIILLKNRWQHAKKGICRRSLLNLEAGYGLILGFPMFIAKQDVYIQWGPPQIYNARICGSL